MTDQMFVLGERFDELRVCGPWNRDEEGLYVNLLRAFEESPYDLAEVLSTDVARARAGDIADVAVKWHEGQRDVATFQGEHEYFYRCVLARILPTLHV